MNKFMITGGPDTHYEPRCGGVRVLHYLANLLALIGEEVVTSFPCCRFFASVPLIRQCGDADDSTIVVYPDSIAGNPRKASKIVRYLLYFSPYLIPSNELPIIYHRMFFDQVAAKCARVPSQDHIITLPSLEPGLLYPEEKTIDSVFFAGKGPSEPPSDAIVIKRFRETRSQAISLLRRARNFYTTDRWSIMPLEAQLCGCRAFVKINGSWEEQPQRSGEGWVMDPDVDRQKAIAFASLCRNFFSL